MALVLFGFSEPGLGLGSYVTLSCCAQLILGAGSWGAGTVWAQWVGWLKCVLWGEDAECASERVGSGASLASQWLGYLISVLEGTWGLANWPLPFISLELLRSGMDASVTSSFSWTCPQSELSENPSLTRTKWYAGNTSGCQWGSSDPTQMCRPYTQCRPLSGQTFWAM